MKSEFTPQGPDGKPMAPVFQEIGIFSYARPEGGFTFAVSVVGHDNLPYMAAWQQDSEYPDPIEAGERLRKVLAYIKYSEGA